jgi:O-antigen ligase
LKSDRKNILLGHGLESRIILFPKSKFTSWESDYIESFISQGLIGLILTIFIYIQFFRGLFQVYFKVKNTNYSKYAFALIASGISIWIISFFSSQLIGKTSSAHFVILYALSILLTNNTQKETNPKFNQS